MATLRFVLSLVLGIALTYGVQRWDRGRLTAAQRARAWNGASWAAALFAFGPFSMVGWACVTRIAAAPWWPRGARRAAAGVLVVAAGFASALIILYVIAQTDRLVAWIAGVPAVPEDSGER
jgi:hypothetical protein